MTHDAPPPRMLSAPLRLTAMTLRGLGPYLHGARLEIKPLTILCGENGSGKSTWIEALRILDLISKEQEADFPVFQSPYNTVSEDAKNPDHEVDTIGSCFERGLLNANLLSFDQSSDGPGIPLEERRRQSNESRERRLAILDKTEDERSSFGPAGCVGLELRVMPKQSTEEVPDLPSASDVSELQTSAQRLLRTGELIPGSTIRLRLASPSIPQNAAGCGGLDGLWDLIELTLNDQFTFHIRRSLDRDWSKDGQGKLRDRRWTVYCSKAFLPGCAADESEAHDLAFMDSSAVEVDELCDRMRCSNCLSGEQGDVSKSHEICDACGGSSALIKSFVANFRRLFRDLTQKALAGFFPIGPIREMHESEIAKLAPSPAMLVRGGMDWVPATLENSEEFNAIRPDQRFVGERGENSQELFGYWAYNRMCQPEEPTSQFFLETYVSYWLDHLVETRVQFAQFPNGRPDASLLHGVEPLNGGMIDREFKWPRTGPFAISIENAPHWCTNGFRDLSRSIVARTSTTPAAWHVMSTGFHQLAPIVVQAGLLRQHEIMAVENPEAHLHPSLQIKVAEFLMHQANADKIMLIETHSDLIVRRVLRAIREEQVSTGNVFKQSTVGINFTSLVPDPQGFKHAKIEKLNINDQGQIGNWPDGFMDDDLKEANNWLAAMERQRSLDDEE